MTYGCATFNIYETEVIVMVSLHKAYSYRGDCGIRLSIHMLHIMDFYETEQLLYYFTQKHHSVEEKWGRK
jgi:hypothetical protein